MRGLVTSTPAGRSAVAGGVPARGGLVVAGTDQDPVARLRGVDRRLDRGELAADPMKASNSQHAGAGRRRNNQAGADRDANCNATHNLSSLSPTVFTDCERGARILHARSCTTAHRRGRDCPRRCALCHRFTLELGLGHQGFFGTCLQGSLRPGSLSGFGSLCMTTFVRRGYWPVGQAAGVPGTTSTCESHRTSERNWGPLLPAAPVCRHTSDACAEAPLTRGERASALAEVGRPAVGRMVVLQTHPGEVAV